jgi:hypothetical protein
MSEEDSNNVLQIPAQDSFYISLTVILSITVVIRVHLICYIQTERKLFYQADKTVFFSLFILQNKKPCNPTYRSNYFFVATTCPRKITVDFFCICFSLSSSWLYKSNIIVNATIKYFDSVRLTIFYCKI